MSHSKAQATWPQTVVSDFFGSDRFLGDGWWEGQFDQSLPAVNTMEYPDGFTIEVAAPGFRKTDFHMKMEGDLLTISAGKKEVLSASAGRYTRREFCYNQFSRAFHLPDAADLSGITFRYFSGILEVFIEKKKSAEAEETTNGLSR
jgi:HSP20 family protein